MSPTSRLRAVLVGCGGISHQWFKTLVPHDDVELVGLVDIQEASARKRADEFGLAGIAIGTDLEAMLAATKPDIVFDCTVPEAHVTVTTTALAHGCHVMGEKPLADSMDHARQMVEAARKAGRLYVVMQNRRYDPQIRRLRAFLESGAIGRVTTVNCDFYLGAHFGGFRDRMKHVLLLDMAIHTFDAARLISGASPRSVFCHEWNPAGSWYDHDASAMAIFEMSDGIVYNYRGSWCSEGLNTSWECDWRIIGERGSVTWDGAAGFRAQVVEETGAFNSKMKDVELPAAPELPHGTHHQGCIRDFVAALREGRTPETVCTDNIRSLAMVFGAIESAETGRKVALGEE
jgi:predicted dehydrogenase